MWKLVSGRESKTHPLLVTLNECQGRQIWVYDEQAGTPEERAAVEDLRSKYKEERHVLKHSADELLRLQCSRVQPVSPSKGVDCPFPSSLEGVTDAIGQAATFYATLQQDDGHWPGDYGGPMFLMPGMVITCYVTGTLDTVLSPKHKEEMLTYLLNHQNVDGGFGLHIEGHSTMFGTGLRCA
jgi:cycloartenol synthase